MACSMSPAASTKAARQSAKPAPVRSRSSFTSCAGGPLFPGSGAVAMGALNSFSFDFNRSGSARPGVCAAARELFRRGFFVARYRGRDFFRDNGLAFDEIAFLLFVFFVRARVHVFRPFFAARAFGCLLIGDLGLLEGLAARENRIGNLRGEQSDGAQ